MTALLRADSVRVDFPSPGGGPPHRALAGVSLGIHEAEAVGLVGESGSGKSTLARVLLGLQRPSAGEAYFGDVPLSSMDRAARLAFRRAVQPVFQDPAASLDPRMRIRDLVGEPLIVHAMGDAKQRARRVDALLERVGLSSDQAGRYPHELSGGQRQRVAIARALAIEPRVVIADEPVSALDVSVQAQILNLFRELALDLKLAYLFVAHDLGAVDFLCDRTFVLHRGEVVEELPRGGLARGATHPYTQQLVEAVASLPRSAADRG